MINSSTTRQQNPSSDSEDFDQVHDQSIVTFENCIRKKEHSWFISSQIPTDLAIQVQEITFNVHKYPLTSKCGYINELDLHPSIPNNGHDIKLDNFPGGPENFEMVLKFCYGLPLDLNPNNIAPLRCASEYLEMSEELEDGNLISKTESFLTFVLLSSWKDTIIVLKSCETLSPWSENLQIVRRCCDSIAWKLSRENSTKLGGTCINIEDQLWFDDVSTLRDDYFMRIITAISMKGINPELVGKCIMHYAEKWLPGMEVELEGLGGYDSRKNVLHLSILSGLKDEGSLRHNKEQKTIVENLISILPPQREAVPCKFLLQVLKMALVYSASPALISELEKRVGIMLDEADANDLLIPSYKRNDQGKPMKSPEDCSVHDVEVVQRIVEYFFMHEQEQPHQQEKSGKSNIISKLIDNYLSEIARDPNLSITKFHVLAESLPENARTCHDGLYRAIDVYLKTHPSLSEHDRRRLCKIMNCEKLSLDACLHAAQNDRLPLRTVIQVLFAEQVKMRAAMQAKEPSMNGDNSQLARNYVSTERDIKSLKLELENVKMHMADLQSDYSELQHEYEKLSNKKKNDSGWNFGWMKIKKASQVKEDGDEIRNERPRSNSVGCKVSLRRRLSES